MQEALVYSQIPVTRVHQVLSILAGLTGTQPSPLCEQTLLFAQNKLSGAPAAPTGAARTKAQQLAREQQQQAARPHHHKLTRDLHSSSGAPSAPFAAADDKRLQTSSSPWVFRAEQVPEPGTKEWLSRAVTEHVATTEELAKFRSVNKSADESQPIAPAYSYKTQYIVRGSRVVHANVVVSIFQILVASGGVGEDIDQDPLDRAPPSPADLPSSEMAASSASSSWRLLDPSGAYVIEAAVRVADPSNARLTGIAVEELAAFKVEMAGAVDFYMPDRFALDTRVKG
jgi:mediator of RNA polymerase II transcription subunit 18